MEEKQITETAPEKKEIRFPEMYMNVTTARIADWMRQIGIECSEGLSNIRFRIDEETYILHTEELPMISVIKWYGVEDDTDMEDVSRQVTDDGKIARSWVSRGEDDKIDGVAFAVSWVEPDMEHFKVVFKEYLDMIESAVNHSRVISYRKQERRRDEKLQLDYPEIKTES